jgi:branched-chain amino acid transport system substrate-binding protein
MKKILVLLIALLVLTSCGSQQTIKIGFIATVSSTQSQLGIDARNGLEILIQDINDNGGINGKTVELIVKDDKNDEATAAKMHSEFIDEGVSFVIGHMTSNMANTMRLNQSEELMFLSPTVSTEAIKEIDDYIFTLIPYNDEQAKTLGSFIASKSDENLTVAYDTANRAYTENLFIFLKTEYEALGKTIESVVPFNSKEDDLFEVATRVAETTTSQVLFISQASNTAILSQYVKNQMPSAKLYATTWSLTKDLVENGGEAVEGMRIIGLYSPIEYGEKYLEFSDKYEQRFHTLPTFSSVLAYDACDVLLQVIDELNSTDVDKVKQGLINLDDFQGLNEPLDFNEYGDSNRQYIIFKVQDGEFEVDSYEW